MVLTLSILKDYLASALFPTHQRKEVFNAGQPMHVHCEVVKQYGIVQYEIEKNLVLPPPEVIIVICEGV